MSQTQTATPPAANTAGDDQSDARYPVDPSSPEFTDLLMQCFIVGRNKAIDKMKQLKAAGLAKEDQLG